MMKKICFVTAIPASAEAFLKDHMAALRKEYEVFYVCNEPDADNVKAPFDGYKCVGIERNISLIKDLKALWQLYRYFRRQKFDAVHSVTPKAGLLTAIAAFFAGVPVRIHIYTGQVWASKTGFMRTLLKTMDRIISLFDNRILVDGEGQRQFLISNGIISAENSQVLGAGSICGVNLERFCKSKEVREEKRKELGIADSTVVFTFMGRLNRDKGLYELLSAFDRLASERDDVYLLLFGNDEENVSLSFPDYTSIKPGENFLWYGPTREPHNMLQAGDVFVLPTYREGFGSSVIEASALGLPVICSDAYGVIDAMVENVTGLRCKVGDDTTLYQAMVTLADDAESRERFGRNGYERVVNEFDGNDVTANWVKYYASVLK